MTAADRGFVGSADADIEHLAQLFGDLGDWLRHQVAHPEDVVSAVALLAGHAIRWDGAHGHLTFRAVLVGDSIRLDITRAVRQPTPIGPLTAHLRPDTAGVEGLHLSNEEFVVAADLGRLLFTTRQDVRLLEHAGVR